MFSLSSLFGQSVNAVWNFDCFSIVIVRIRIDEMEDMVKLSRYPVFMQICQKSRCIEIV